MSNGPVCHIPPPNTVGNPQARNMPGLPGNVSASSPSFNNDISNAINALLQAMRTLLNQLNNNNNVTGTISSPKPASKANWIEQNRVTDKVKIYQNNDPNTGVFVEVEQINQLTMKDKTTGNTWQWNRDGNA